MQFERILYAALRRLPFVNRYEVRRRIWTFNGLKAVERTRSVPLREPRGLSRIHYACGKHFLSEWLNVDSYLQGDPRGTSFQSINLISRHPFPDDTFEFSFAEDFLEHLSQVDSLLFLSESRRTLKPDGVLRLSFPGLEGVLQKHYPAADWETVNIAKEEAYTRYEHLHFYSRDKLSLVARHLGFTAVTYHAFGDSPHAALQGIDQRATQRDLNTYAELRK